MHNPAPEGLSLGEKPPAIVTAGGWARSGKGTSMADLQEQLVQVGQQVELIDQGVKFRVMGEVARAARQPLDSPTTLNDFIQSAGARRSTLAALAEVSTLDSKAKKDRLYTPELSKAAGKVGKVAAAHEVAIGLLRAQVQEAAEAGAGVILIDGRSIEGHAKKFTEEGLARFVMGWYFKCDPAIAARRSLGLFAEFDDLTTDERHELLAETLNISDRNRSDTLRAVDPLHEPARAYRLDLSSYHAPDADIPYKRAVDILHTGGGMTVVDTSYTNSIEEMAEPVTRLSMLGLMKLGPLSHADVGIRTLSFPVEAHA
jgi:cytidylate kinase